MRLSLANIERVEVVKGAAANLYGRIEPGGMINLITKRPQAEAHYSLNQQVGSFGQYSDPGRCDRQTEPERDAAVSVQF
jgi:iron complex outermembrane receptor protein